MLFTAVVALTESVCCVCRDKHHIKKKQKKHKKPTEATNYNGEDCIYVTAEASQVCSDESVKMFLQTVVIRKIFRFRGEKHVKEMH